MLSFLLKRARNIGTSQRGSKRYFGVPSSALKHRDWWVIMGAIARGVSRVGHHGFMDTIWKAGKSRR